MIYKYNSDSHEVNELEVYWINDLKWLINICLHHIFIYI